MRFSKLIEGFDLGVLPPEFRAIIDGIVDGCPGVFFSLPPQCPGRAILVVAEGGMDGSCVTVQMQSQDLATLIEQAARIKGLLDAGVRIDHVNPKSLAPPRYPQRTPSHLLHLDGAREHSARPGKAVAGIVLLVPGEAAATTAGASFGGGADMAGALERSISQRVRPETMASAPGTCEATAEHHFSRAILRVVPQPSRRTSRAPRSFSLIAPRMALTCETSDSS